MKTSFPWVAAVLGGMLLSAAAEDSPVAVASTPAVQLSKIKAVQMYPSLALEGSEFNQVFITIIRLWKGFKPELLQRDDWPEAAANAAAKEIETRRAKEKADKEINVRISR